MSSKHDMLPYAMDPLLITRLVLMFCMRVEDHVL